MATTLPVESSWRMVEGEHDSFETSVVPNDDGDANNSHARSNDVDDDPFQAHGCSDGSGDLAMLRKMSMSGPDRGETLPLNDNNDDDRLRRLAPGDSYSSVATSAGEDDLQAFLRKAARDDGGHALLRSPFQPSLPSSVRQSPLGSGNGATPEPALRMPVLDMAGSANTAGAFASGSPVPRRRRQQQRRGSAGLGGGGRRRSWGPAGTRKEDPLGSAMAAFRPRLLLLPLLVCAVVAAYCCCYLRPSVLPAGTVAQVWRLPGLSSLAGCAALLRGGPAPATSTSYHDRDGDRPPHATPRGDDRGLANSAEALMHWQAQLVDVVRARVPTRAGRSSSSISSHRDQDDKGGAAGAVPPNAADAASQRLLLPHAHDAWLVPRARTKALRSACSADPDPGGGDNALLRRTLDAYLDDARRVSTALARLQAGAAAVAAGPLAHRTHQTLAQLRRLAAAAATAATVDGRLSATAERPLRDAYRRHAGAVLAKAAARTRETAAVVAALDAAGRRLDDVAGMVAARRDAFRSGSEGTAGAPPRPGPGLLSRLWGWLSGRGRTASSSSDHEWAAHAATLEALQAQHAEAVGRAADTLDELAAVQDALEQLQSRFAGGGDGGGDGVSLRLHRDIVEEGLRALERRR